LLRGILGTCAERLSIELELQELGCEGMDWIELAQDKDRCRVLVTAVMNYPIP